MKVRISKHPDRETTWLLFMDGRCDWNFFRSWTHALKGAVHRKQLAAVRNLLQEIQLVEPGEYVGISAACVCGHSMARKRDNLADGARRLGLCIDIEIDHDDQGNHDFYVQLIRGKA